MDPGSPDPAAALRRVGLRVTASRLAVLRALAATAPHSSVDAVVSGVRERLGDGSAQTVYNVLRTFTDVGLVRRIEPAGRPGLYELRVGDNHHHIVCRTCDAIADVDCAVGETPCLTAARQLRLRDRRSRGHLLGPMPRVCRGDFCLVRRVKANTQRATPAGRHSLGSRATRVESNRPSQGNTERGEGATCLIGRT